MEGVVIEAEGTKHRLDDFLISIRTERPPKASIQSCECSQLDPAGFSNFEIRESVGRGQGRALVLPDIATCADCLAEVFDPANRRYLYPFTNCTNCGPRFTIIERLPYDRANTTMRVFTMCDDCRSEYDDPADRRFHAQPNACPQCGPHVEAWLANGQIVASEAEAIRFATEALKRGQIVAVKGIGGFQLMVDVMNEAAVLRLRRLKHREQKPFALMASSVRAVQTLCLLDPLEERVLTASEAPIVLLTRRKDAALAASIAPGNPYLGVMLPYSPLHHILLRETGGPVVATSGNQADEPIAIDVQDACRRLGAIADVFLVHNRRIQRHADDSIVRIILGREQVLRRARGYAPLPVFVNRRAGTTLAVGGHLKNTVALAVDSNVFISQHIGDLETHEANTSFTRVIDDLQTLYGTVPEVIGCDMHPDYRSSIHAVSMASRRAIPLFRAQHHWAHLLACMAENSIDAPALGVVWDGTGYGVDGTVWGGEFLLAMDNGFRRAAHFRYFPLPGGDAAIKRPRQTMLGVLYELLGSQAFTDEDPQLVRQMLDKRVRSPKTSSVGRLFDAVACLIGLNNQVSFEGQAAMALEFAADRGVNESYPYGIRPGTPLVVDWEPIIRGVMGDLGMRVRTETIAAKFHNTLVEIIVAVAERIGQRRIVLTGGCFQNRYLTERAVQRLVQQGFACYWNQRVPPNDGGIALGQIIAADHAFQQEHPCVLQFQAK
jgi:hydrogenase maturation protein HypF